MDNVLFEAALRVLDEQTHSELKGAADAITEVIKAARCIRHWHDTGEDGMVVSKRHVIALWDALDKYDKIVAAFPKGVIP